VRRTMVVFVGVVIALAASLLGASAAWAQFDADDFRKVQLVDTTLNPMEIEVAPDGTVFYIERRGVVGVWDPDTETSREIGTVPVTTFEENGLLGIALDPNYELNGWIYLAYSVPPVDTLTQRVSRFKLDENGNLDLSSEVPIFEWTHLRETCCHSAGALEFDPDGNLLISTGDNTNPFASNGYAPIDERPGRVAQQRVEVGRRQRALPERRDGSLLTSPRPELVAARRLRPRRRRSRPRSGAATSAAGPPSCGAGRRVTPTRPAPRRSRGA